MQVQGKRILIFGDSLSHHGSDSASPIFEAGTAAPTASSPGDLLAARLLAQGAAAVRIDARVGRSAYNFFSREAWRELLAADAAWRPDVVLIILGTNDLGMGVQVTTERMRQIRDNFPLASVIGIGPPSFASAKNSNDAIIVVQLMRTVFSKFIDSRPLTTDLIVQGRAKDGVHFTATGAKAFAERLLLTLLGDTPKPPSPTTPSLPKPSTSWGLSHKNLTPVYVGVGVGLVGAIAVAVVLHKSNR